MSEILTKLIVDAGHPAVRIEVLDAGYLVKASGYGKIEEDLPSGYYTIQYKAADALQERDITILPNTPLTIADPPDLPFSSAAPLVYTSTSNDYHQVNASRLSQAPPLPRGAGSQIFVFVRDLQSGGGGHPADGLSLHRLSGEALVNFDEVVESGAAPEEAAWGGRNIEVDPGIYRLRLAFPDEPTIEMALPACPNWQTQVFLLRQGGEREIAGMPLLDLSNAAQMMSRPLEGFTPRSDLGTPHGGFATPRSDISTQKRVNPYEAGEDLRLMELARQALAHGYRGIRSSDLHDMLWGKWRDPLLGILGVHLLLQGDDPDLGFAKSVVERLQGILSGFRHPDVDALALEIARRRGEPIEMAPFEAPPMLRHSWNMLIKATTERPELIAYDSLPFKISDLLWGASAWLIWEMPTKLTEMMGAGEYARTSPAGAEVDVDDYGDRIVIGDVTLYKRQHAKTAGDVAGIVERGGSTQPPVTDTNIDMSDFESLRTAISELLAALQTGTPGAGIDDLTSKMQLSGVEYALLAQFQGRQLALDKGYSTRPEAPITPELLVRQLCIPAELVLEAMGNLYVKLKILEQEARSS